MTQRSLYFALLDALSQNKQFDMCHAKGRLMSEFGLDEETAARITQEWQEERLFSF